MISPFNGKAAVIHQAQVTTQRFFALCPEQNDFVLHLHDFGGHGDCWACGGWAGRTPGTILWSRDRLDGKEEHFNLSGH
jgi:hypothetical protein